MFARAAPKFKKSMGPTSNIDLLFVSNCLGSTWVFFKGWVLGAQGSGGLCFRISKRWEFKRRRWLVLPFSAPQKVCFLRMAGFRSLLSQVHNFFGHAQKYSIVFEIDHASRISLENACTNVFASIFWRSMRGLVADADQSLSGKFSLAQIAYS